MFGREKYSIALCVIYLLFSTLSLSPIVFAQDELNDQKIIERYKLMLSQKPRESNTFDRLYQLYLEGPGLDSMVADYQLQAEAKPNNANIQLILGHIYKRLGKDTEALSAYQRAVTLAPNDYYTYFALGQFYVTLRKNEEAIRELTKSISLSEQSQSVSPEELTAAYKALGHAYFSRDKLDEAIQAWEKISLLDPQNIFARLELADLFREQELYPQAIKQHQAIIEIKKDDPYRKCLSLREIGKIHEDTGAYQEALKHYDEALTLTASGNWLRKDLQHRIIALYSTDANWKDLITYYQDKLETTPNDPELLGLLASAYIQNQQLEEGISTYRKGLELAPADTGLRLKLIDALRNSEMSEDAAAEYELLTEQHPDDFGIYRELGKLYVQLKNVDKAKAVYQKMIDRDPENAGTFLTLAEIYTGHEWMDEAVAAYQKAISLAPDNLDYVEYFGEFYFRQGNREKAVETWNKMVAGDRETAENFDRLAGLLEAKTFPDKAIEASRKAVELMPDAYRYREALAKKLMNHKQYDDALLEYTEAMKLAPNAFFADQMDDKRIELYRRQGTLVKIIDGVESELEKPGLTQDEKFPKLKRLAKMYLKLGNTTYALEILLKAKEIQPNDITVNRWAAVVYVKQGRRDEAITIYEHLTEIDSTNAREYYAKIANAYLKAMDFENATASTKQVIAHSPRNPEGHQLLAQIARQSGDYESAIDSYKQAIRLRPEAIDIRTELAGVYNLAGNTRQAIAQYWRCWELSDNVNDKLSFIKPLSEAYYNLGRRDELEVKLKQIAHTNTSDVAPVLALAQVYRNQGDLSSARFQLAKALDRKSDSPELLFQLVEISLDQGESQEAINYQRQLVKLDPNPRNQQKLGELLFDIGREQEAVQAWSKVLHAKNQTLDAEIRLSKLLIEHGLMEEALFALENAAEKISGPDAHIGLYQIGATFVKINEPEKALPYFQRIIEMSKPEDGTSLATATDKLTSNLPYGFYGPPGINTNQLNLASMLTNRVSRPQHSVRRGTTPWIPSTFEESQAATLVQLKTILEDNGELNDLIDQFEKKVTANPKDVHTLELLGQLYILTDNHEKTDETVDRLIAASPNNLVYQGIKLKRLALQDQFNYDSFKKHLDQMTGLTADARNWYISEYAALFTNQGKRADAEKLLDELEGVNINNLSNKGRLLDIYVRMGKAEAAEKFIAQLPASTTGQFSHQYSRIYESIANTFLREGHTDKAIEFFWKYIETTNPNISNTRRVASMAHATYYSGNFRYQTNFPSPTTYFSSTRLEFIKKFFNKIWMSEQQESLYTILQGKYDAAEGKNRIYPALAISYCNWWDGKRDKALEILNTLQKEFPEDLTLKLHTIFVSIQSGKHNVAIEFLKELAHADPRNLSQYYDLTLHLAMHSGNTTTVRELMKNLLNSPTGVQELFNLSKKLQSGGFTQYAVAVSKRTTDLAMTERDPNFLRQLSQHLKDLGRGQDAARLIERAARFENLRVLSGQTLPTWNMTSTAPSVKRQKLLQDREAKLARIAEKNPTSYKAQANLAAFYKSRNQFSKASEAYEAALALRPDAGTMRREYATMLQQRGQVKKAVTHLSILLKENFQTLQQGHYYYETIMKTFIQAGEINKLVSVTKDIIDGQTQYGRGMQFAQQVARHFMEINNAKLAIEIYEKMLKSGLDYSYHDLVSAYVKTGKREKAIELLRKRLKTGPVDAQVRVILRLSEFKEALDEIKNLTTEYEAKLAEDSVEPSMLYLLSVLKIVTNDIEGSDSYVSKLLEDIPIGVRMSWLNTIANTYRSKSESERELRLLEAAIEKVDLQNTWQLSDTYRKLGTAYSNKGEKEKAHNAFRKMGTLRLLGRSGSVHWEKESIARTYMQHGMYDDAEVLLTDVVNDLSTQHYYRERAQEQLMTIKINRDGVDATSDGKNPMAHVNIGLLRSKAQQHQNRRQFPEAIKAYEQIVKLVPEDLESQSKLASLYSDQNQHDKAIATWKTLIQSDSANTKYQDGIVNAYHRAGKISEAIRLAQEYIKSDPDIGLHHTRLAQLYVANHQTDDAITTYNKAIELSPGDSSSYEELGKLYLGKNELDAAEKSFKDALQYVGQGGNRRDVELQLLGVYQRQGKFEEVLKQAEEQGTLTLDMQKERARIYHSKGELEKAAEAYKKALKMTGNNYARNDVQSQLMDIYSKLGKLEEFLKEAEDQGTLTFDMQKKRARIYQDKGELEKAVKAYKKALELTTESHYRRQVERDMMNLVRRSGKMEEFLKEAEKDGTITYDMQMELARHYSTRRESEKAVEAFKKARNMSTDSYRHDEISKFLMLEYARIGNYDSAIELYEELHQPDSDSTDNYSGTYYGGSAGFKINFPGDEAREGLIQAFRNLRKLDELKTIFESKLEEDPNNIGFLKIIAEINSNSNNHKKEAEVYQTLCKVEPNNAFHFYHAAAALHEAGNQELAKEFLNKGEHAFSSSSHKNNTSYLSALGSICYQSKMYKPAIAHFKNAVKATEANSFNRNNDRWRLQYLYELLGKSYLITKQYEEAVEAYQKMADISTSSHTKETAEKAIQQAYKEGNLHEKRIPKQLEKVNQNPDDVDARLALAKSYELSEKFDEALTQYEKISELQPDVVKWHKTVGDLYEKSTKTDKSERLAKAAAAYEKAIALEPDSYELYNLLAQTHTKNGDTAKAEAVYQKALEASLTSQEHDLVVTAILELYDAKKQTDKRLATLEGLKTKTENSALLHKLLGDTYLESGDTDKAAIAYKKWLEIHQSGSNQRNDVIEIRHHHGSIQRNNATEYHQLAERLLNQNIMPDIALELAKRTTEIRSDSVYISTLGQAYLANEQYDKALEQFQRSFNLSNQSGRYRENTVEHLLKRISQAGKNVKDKARYTEMLEKLMDVLPNKLGNQLNINLKLAEFCREIGMTDKAKAYIQKTGFFPETAWLTLGPFDNTKKVGYNTAYIPEETGQIDTTAKYDGVTGQLTWKQGSDDTFDGFFEFGKDENWHTAYAWISFTSPEERKVQIRFDSDDQGKVWLNGKKVYAHRRTRGATIDRRTIPATLIAGENTILVKVCNESLPWGFYLRITNTDGNPFNDLTFGNPESE